MLLHYMSHIVYTNLGHFVYIQSLLFLFYYSSDNFTRNLGMNTQSTGLWFHGCPDRLLNILQFRCHFKLIPNVCSSSISFFNKGCSLLFQQRSSPILRDLICHSEIAWFVSVEMSSDFLGVHPRFVYFSNAMSIFLVVGPQTSVVSVQKVEQGYKQ